MTMTMATTLMATTMVESRVVESRAAMVVPREHGKRRLDIDAGLGFDAATARVPVPWDRLRRPYGRLAQPSLMATMLAPGRRCRADGNTV
jgi:hypothetical protein